MLDMAKPPAAEAKKPKRSPAWEIYARLDPDLKPAFEAYREKQEYPPNLARVIERALKKLFEESGDWPLENS